MCEQAPPCAHKGLSEACPEPCPEPGPESLFWSLSQAVKFLNPHGLRGQPCPLPCPALSVPCPDLQRRINSCEMCCRVRLVRSLDREPCPHVLCSTTPGVVDKASEQSFFQTFACPCFVRFIGGVGFALFGPCPVFLGSFSFCSI